MAAYNKRPARRVADSCGRVFTGGREITDCLQENLTGDEWILVAETYPGVSEDRIRAVLEGLKPDLVLWAGDMLKDTEELEPLLRNILTEDRVFGRMYFGGLMDFVDPVKLSRLRDQASQCKGRVLIYGFGAGLVSEEGLLVYADISRWEIQLRYRAGMPNYLSYNPEEDILKKYKQGYFLEWRIADRWKMSCMERMRFYLDANRDAEYVMIRKDLYEEALYGNTCQPFRTVPYFDPGVWGGQWMKKVCGLDPARDNYAWSFDGVPEENSLCFDLDGTMLEMPAMNLVLAHPERLLGERVYARYGAEFPIRFDFLDTMGGQNLSLQVHPTTDYIRRQFGMAYTQDESYYMLDAGPDACVYLGLREDADTGEMITALRQAQEQGTAFDAEKYVNKIPAKKHDHFLIPAGTIHCSGSNAMVLEISATPYIFTFKLWDWGRLGLDGKPRPINIRHGEKVIRERRTGWVMENLVNHTHMVREEETWSEEHTGLHPLEPIETRRFRITDTVEVNCHESVNMLNLVEGERCLVESTDSSFSPYEVHYAETFIVPAAVGSYRLRAVDGPVMVLQAYIRLP